MDKKTKNYQFLLRRERGKRKTKRKTEKKREEGRGVRCLGGGRG
jgi:hypothetical protein